MEHHYSLTGRMLAIFVGGLFLLAILIFAQACSLAANGALTRRPSARAPRDALRSARCHRRHLLRHPRQWRRQCRLPFSFGYERGGRRDPSSGSVSTASGGASGSRSASRAGAAPGSQYARDAFTTAGKIVRCPCGSRDGGGAIARRSIRPARNRA